MSPRDKYLLKNIPRSLFRELVVVSMLHQLSILDYPALRGKCGKWVFHNEKWRTSKIYFYLLLTSIHIGLKEWMNEWMDGRMEWVWQLFWEEPSFQTKLESTLAPESSGSYLTCLFSLLQERNVRIISHPQAQHQPRMHLPLSNTKTDLHTCSRWSGKDSPRLVEFLPSPKAP